METVNVLGKYNVYIGSGILNNIDEIVDVKNFSKVIVICDEKLPEIMLNQFPKINIPSGEINKNIETVQKIWKKLLELGADRKTLIINLGGGVIGDMGGFAASTFMRGVKFLQVPTTVLSAVDASVGGKVGIDFAGVKNLIGSFNQPVGVLIDIDTLSTLPEREFISGFGEIIKHGIIADKKYFEKVTSKKPREFTKKELIKIIKRSCEIKAEIISGDEKESGQRKLLNLGHTIGHALESASLQTDQPLLHGEAVSLGIVAEAKISQELGIIDEQAVLEIKTALKNANLPVTYQIEDIDKILALITKDKKAESGKVNWTLIERIGNAVFDKHVDESLIKSAIQFLAP